MVHLGGVLVDSLVGGGPGAFGVVLLELGFEGVGLVGGDDWVYFHEAFLDGGGGGEGGHLGGRGGGLRLKHFLVGYSYFF